jgi:uncharacterized protein with FMN-binding domain
MNQEPRPAQRERCASGGKVANRLVALSSAAVLTVYAAGYARTRPAAERLETAERPRFVSPARPATSGHAVAASSPSRAAAGSPAVGKTTSSGHPRAPKPAARAAHPAAAAPVSTGTVEAPVAVPAVEAAPPVVEAPAVPAQPQYKDGTYAGWGTSRHGDIEATVVIESGRIASAVISQCWTRYSCSCVAHLQGQVVGRQSPEVDYVSGATQSVNAFYYAVVQALSKAK